MSHTAVVHGHLHEPHTEACQQLTEIDTCVPCSHSAVLSSSDCPTIQAAFLRLATFKVRTTRVLGFRVTGCCLQIEAPRTEDIECLCKLMSTVGSQLENSPKFVKAHMDAYFDRMDKMSKLPTLEVGPPFMWHTICTYWCCCGCSGCVLICYAHLASSVWVGEIFNCGSSGSLHPLHPSS